MRTRPTRFLVQQRTEEPVPDAGFDPFPGWRTVHFGEDHAAADDAMRDLQRAGVPAADLRLLIAEVLRDTGDPSLTWDAAAAQAAADLAIAAGLEPWAPPDDPASDRFVLQVAAPRAEDGWLAVDGGDDRTALEATMRRLVADGGADPTKLRVVEQAV